MLKLLYNWKRDAASYPELLGKISLRTNNKAASLRSINKVESSFFSVVTVQTYDIFHVPSQVKGNITKNNGSKSKY